MHRWDVSVEEAIQIQQNYRNRVEQTTRLAATDFKTVAGIDVSYKGEIGRAAALVFSLPDMRLLEQATAVQIPTFPYVPGLLSFREVPVVLAALDKLTVKPDLLLCDGQGYAHPRRFGLACHLGVYLNWPSIGCAKSWLIGSYQPPGPEPGDYSWLEDTTATTLETIGVALRTRRATKPLFVSVGHKIDLPTAIEITLKCLRGYRVPEPTRQADIVAGAIPLP